MIQMIQVWYVSSECDDLMMSSHYQFKQFNRTKSTQVKKQRNWKNKEIKEKRKKIFLINNNINITSHSLCRIKNQELNWKNCKGRIQLRIENWELRIWTSHWIQSMDSFQFVQLILFQFKCFQIKWFLLSIEILDSIQKVSLKFTNSKLNHKWDCLKLIFKMLKYKLYSSKKSFKIKIEN